MGAQHAHPLQKRELSASEEAGAERERSGDVGGEIDGIVTAGIDMKFMRDSAGGEDFVEGRGACFEAVIILVAAIEIDFQQKPRHFSSPVNRRILLPEHRVGWTAKCATENAGARGLRSIDEGGKFFDERGAVSADGTEKLRMTEGKMESAV